MSTFTCRCGSICRDEDSLGASYVAYLLPVLSDLESRIATLVEEFLSCEQQVDRSAWITACFGPNYPIDEANRGVLEDIVARELNDGFTPVFRCPTCGRVAWFDHTNSSWDFYVLEKSTNA